ncbi:hypothetical protein TrST_g2311 [Triparma strigata]|uniref:WRKY19-like zinc finger domain-containing protein n=1 Tax=Triparma strigata TaxID=1606541 RepID=A0A9W7BE54_9STRA|nr:hypothetical protein TrST_g2311 [Triparma strigata]
MDPSRIKAYLQTTCSALGFDIGEVWWCKKQPSDGSIDSDSKKFVQLYTSKSYELHRSSLVSPLGESPSTDSEAHDVSKHVLSPQLVDAISSSTQVVWSTCTSTNGLLGRSDMKLHTAVGMPVAVDSSGNMCVVVMFGAGRMESNVERMEYLQSIFNFASDNMGGCMPLISNSEKEEELDKSSTSIVSSNCGSTEGITTHFISLRKSIRRTLSSNNLHNIEEDRGKGVEITHVHTLSAAPKDKFGIPMLPKSAEVDFEERGVPGMIKSEESSETGSQSPDSEVSDENPPPPSPPSPVQNIDEYDYGLWTSILETPSFHPVSSAPTSLTPSTRDRVEEFVTGFLGLSVFDACDVWVKTPAGLSQIFSMKCESAPDGFECFQVINRREGLKKWDGAIGRCYATGDPVWEIGEGEYDEERRGLLKKADVNTIMAVPVHSRVGGGPPDFVVAFYSRDVVEPISACLRFVQQAVKMVWSSEEGGLEDVNMVDVGEIAGDMERQKEFSKKRNIETVQALQGMEVTTSDQPRYKKEEWIVKSETTTAKNFVMQQAARQRLPHMMSSITERMYGSSSGMNLGLGGEAVLPQHIISEDDAFEGFEPSEGLDHSQSKRRKSGDNNTGGFPPFPSSFFQSPPPPTSSSAALDPLDATYHGSSSLHFTNSFTFDPGLNLDASYHGDPAYMTQTTYTTAPIMRDPNPPINYFGSNGIDQFNYDPKPAAAERKKPKATTRRRSNPKNSAGATKACRILGCEALAANRRPYCVKHSGSRQCEHPSGCGKCAQGSTRFCIAHGGGRRCTFIGCDKGARDKFFCAAHGGGKRCSIDGCSKSAVGGSAQCTSHGGGKRCKVQGCEKSAQSSTNFCVRHGGGKKCAHENGDGKRCDKVARGRTDYCASHGGGIRCKLENCNRVAIGKLQLCRSHGQQAPKLQGTFCLPLGTN